MRFFKSLFICYVVSISLLCGCAHLKESAKRFWGSSVADLEEARKDAKSEEFEAPLSVCFDKVLDIFKDIDAEAYIINKKKNFIAAINFKGAVDTTRVGVFFTSLENGRTKIEVSSLSPMLASSVAQLLFTSIKENKTIQADR